MTCADSQPLAADLALSYSYDGAGYRVIPPEYLDDPPARAMTTTADDVARFMLAHLDEGRYGSGRILEPTTLQEMHRQQFSHDPRLPGTAFAFQEWPTNGQRVLGHHGTGTERHSALVLLPEQRVGFFIAYTRAGYGLFSDVFERFMDSYYPGPPSAAPAAAPTGGRTDLGRLEGNYRPSVTGCSSSTAWRRPRWPRWPFRS